MASSTNITPNALKHLILRAITESPTTAFSHSFPPDPAKVAAVTNLLRRSEHPLVRLQALADPSLATQFLFVLAGQIFPLTRPCIATTAGNTAVYIGNMSDELGECIPIEVPAQGFTGWFTSIIPGADATAYDLPTFLEPPDTISGKDGTAGSIERLNWGPDADTADLMITAVPMVLPVPAGVHLPTDTWEVGVSMPEVTQVYPFIEIWRRAHHYIIQNNEGFSVTVDGPLFDQTDITHGQTPSITIEPRGALTLQTLVRTDAHFTPVKVTTKEAHNAAYIRIGNELPMATPTGSFFPTAGGSAYHHPPGAVTAHQAGLSDVDEQTKYDQLVHALTKNPRTPETTEKDKVQDKVLHRFQIAFASVETVEGDKIVSLATMKPGFVEVIKSTNLLVAKSLWKDILAETIEAAKSSDNRLDGGATIQATDLSDSVFVACLREFKFLRKSLTTESAMNDAKTSISILVFADPLKEAKAYTDRMVNEQLLSCQEAVGEEKSKMTRKTTELYIGGALFHVDNVKTLLCNFRLFCLALTNDFERSELWKILGKLEDNLHKLGREWSEQLSAKYKHAALIMAIDIQNVICQFFIISDMLAYRNAVAAGDQIHPDVYRNAGAVGHILVSSMYTDILARKVKTYEEVPEIAHLLPHLNLVGDKKMPAVIAPNHNPALPGNINQKPGNAVPAGHTPDGNKRGQAGNNKQDLREEREVEKSIGFLAWTGNGTPPRFCQVFVKTGSMKVKERVCLWYCTQGSFCGRGKDKCRQGHIKSFGTLNKEEQKKMEDFVKITPGLEFVSGQGPKGTE